MNARQFRLLLAAAIVSAIAASACTADTRHAPAYSAGKAVDAALLAKLTSSLNAELVKLGKIDPATGAARVESAPPQGDANRPQIILAQTQEDGTLLLRWVERLNGDYDLSGDVGIPDITPIATSYLLGVEWYPDGTPVAGVDNETLAVIDGDKSDNIGISDITPIAMNYLATLSGYNLYRDGALIAGAGAPTAPTMPRPASGEYGWRDGRWPVYEFTDSPGGTDRNITYSLKPVEADGIEGDAWDFIVHYTPSTPVNLPPAAPTGLIATAGDAQVVLDWGDNTESDLAGYNVYLSVNPTGPPASPVNGALITESTYTADSLINGTLYYFWVTALDDALPANESDYSARADATPTAPAGPQPPTGLIATPGDGSVSLDWDDSLDPSVVGFNVYQSTDGADPNPALITGTPVVDSQYFVSPLTNDTTYYFWVSALDDAVPPAESAKTGPADATPQAGANLPPTAVAGANPLIGNAPLSVDFTGFGSADTDGSIVMFRWDFTDDGTWDYEDAAVGDTNFIYDTPGVYTARLQVVDDDGATGEDTVSITVNQASQDWQIEVVDPDVTLLYLALDHYPNGEPTIAATTDAGASKREVHFYSRSGETYTDELVASSGGEALQIAVAGDTGVYIGHAQYNQMFEDMGYVDWKRGDTIIWNEISYGTIRDNSTIAVGASPEKIACSGIQMLAGDGLEIHYDISGDVGKYPLSIRPTEYANIAMKSDGSGATWFLDESLMWHMATLDGTKWSEAPAPDLDYDDFGHIFRVEYVEAIESYVGLGYEPLTESELLSRFVWDGSSYQTEIIGTPTFMKACRFGAIGLQGEVFYCINRNDGEKHRVFISCYLDASTNVDDIPLVSLLSDGPAAFAELDVRPDGTPAIVFQMEASTTLYYATFPHPLFG